MWNPSSKDLADRFGKGKSVPSDVDYGTYISKELMSLGYAPKQLFLAGQAVFIAAMPVMNGLSEAVLICRSCPGTINQAAARVMMSFRSMRRAACYIVVTNGKMDLPALQVMNMNKVICVDQFFVGDDVTRILGKAGLVPDVLLGMLSKHVEQTAKLSARLQATREELAYQEQQAQAATQIAAGERPRKRPDQMNAMEKYEAGMMDSDLASALRAIAGTNAVTANALMKRLHCSPEKAELLLSQMEELNVVTPSKPNSPRFVKMSRAMLDKQFRLNL